MKLRLEKSFIRELKKLDRSTQIRILAHLKLFEAGKKVDVKKLKGFKNIFRLRVGEYRIKFAIENAEIIVFDVKKRGKIY
jgi:mRNA interferase RelE/StbE